MPANIAQFLDAAERNTPGWRIFREGRRVSDPVCAAVLDRARRAIAANVAHNHLGAGPPSPLVEAALDGYVRFAEAVIDDWVDRRALTRPQVEALLAGTLGDVIARTRAMDASSDASSRPRSQYLGCQGIVCLCLYISSRATLTACCSL